jgi:ABC-type transport system substrate-binding protein
MAMSKVLRVGLLTPPDKLDPKALQHETAIVLQQILETPYGPAPGSNDVVPLLFEGPLERVGTSQPAVYRGRVRGNVLFSDGLPLSSHHVAACLRQSAVIRVQAYVGVDDDSVSFTLKRPNGRLDLSLSHVQCSVFRLRGETPIGTGPFEVAADSRPERVHLVRNRHSRQRAPMDEIVFQAFPPDPDGHSRALLAALEKGEVDVTTLVPRDDVERLRGLRKSVQPGLGTAILYLNAASPRLKDARARRALAHAIQREALASDVYSNALAFTATSVLPRGLTATPARDGLAHDARRAQALWAELGADAPRRLSLLLIWGPRAYLPNPAATAARIATQLAPLGIELELVRTSTVTEYCERQIAGHHDLTLGGWTADTLDPCDFLEANLASERVPAWANIGISANNGRIKSADMDRALADYRAQRTPQGLEEIMRLLTAEAPLVPLFYGSTALVHSFRVTQLRPTPLGWLDLATADLVA